MRLNALVGLLLSITAVSGHASSFAVYSGGFIDERASAQPAVTASATDPKAAPIRGALTGDFSLKEWDQVAPSSSANGSDLSLAIVRLLPPNKPAVEIDAPLKLIDKMVTWSAGVSRRQALQEIAQKNDLNINIEGRVVTIRPVVQPPKPKVEASTQAVAKVTVKPEAPAAAALKSFEVKLMDIKLSTSMARWAADSGIRIRWDADKHVLIGAPMMFAATSAFDAVTQALSTPGIKNSDYPLEVCEYPNTPILLRITRQGEQAKDCPSK